VSERVLESGGVWASGDSCSADTKGWVSVREHENLIQISVPKDHYPMLTPDAALNLSRQIRRLALRIKATQQGE
jgi:hypothetical protein